jgi:hypothetical protein
MPPVLLVAFNRPKETARVIARLREVKPARVYFAVDGAREGRSEDAELVELTKQLAKEFDWDCELRTAFQAKNLGCGLGVSTAISWALTIEESVIVLEDDILPDPSFFPFCEVLLKRFKNDDRIFAISGCNYVPNEVFSDINSYRFSRIPHVWGWAVWKRSWDTYNFDIKNWKQEVSFSQLRHQLGGSWLAAILWRKLFDLVAQNKIDTWDYQLAFASLKSKSLVATSNVNLTENLGFGPGATHTQRIPKYIRPTIEIEFPLRHPHVELDDIANNWTQKKVHGARVISGITLLVKYLKMRTNRHN